jgi:hypothetical protein
MQQLADGLEVAIPTAIVIRNQVRAFCVGQRHKLRHFCRRGTHWLIDNNAFARFKNLPRNLKVRAAGRGYNEQADRSIGQRLFNGVRCRYAWVSLCGAA